jgi:hypothetical protein
MSSTMVFQVNGTACASSKKRRARSEFVEAAAGALAKEAMVVPIGGMPCCIAENDVLFIADRLVCDRLSDAALSESMDVAGDTPSDRKERRWRRFCTCTRQFVNPHLSLHEMCTCCDLRWNPWNPV